MIHTTKKGVEVLVSKGSKKESPYDFMVHYKEPNKRRRTPRHIHIVIDLYMKLRENEELTLTLIDHIIDIIKKVKPITEYPPKLQLFKTEDVKKFEGLNGYGEYTLDFILPVVELIMIQEKTNYPTGTMNLKVFEKFGHTHSDIFSVVSAATFRNK